MSKILYSIIDDLIAREDKGLKEYGTTMDRTDLTEQEWLQHAYEEALDLSIYLKKIIKTKNIDFCSYQKQSFKNKIPKEKYQYWYVLLNS